MRLSKYDVSEMMKHKKADIMKEYGISKIELTRCYKFFSFKKWNYCKWNNIPDLSKKERESEFWKQYEDGIYASEMKDLFHDLENTSNVHEFLQLIEQEH